MKARFNYPELALAGFFLALSSWYLWDAYRASAGAENMLLILPASIVVIILCLWIIGSTLWGNFKARPEAQKTEQRKKPEKKQVSILGAMAIMVCFVLSMEHIGFDVATFLFIAALMFLQGERRPLWLVGFSLVFAVLVSLFFEYMIPYPMPMLLSTDFLEKLL